MNLAIATQVQTPHEAFSAASASYHKAIDSITFEPNERVDVRAAVSDALQHATEAVSYLQPFSNAHADKFTDRNATASIKAAATGVTALNTALATLTAPGADMPQIPVATFLTIAQNSFTTAEGILWQESVSHA